jgi:tRNA dimethylallyltransferase
MDGAARSPLPVFLGGPTGAGKSEVALLLAQALGGEIISVDSMQVFRGMDIGTAKPSIAERQLVRHYLIDIAEPSEAFSAAQFVQKAGEALAGIEARRRRPVFCGGTGLYFKALLQGLGEAPPPDPLLRKQLEAMPLKDLLDELARADSGTFANIDQHNRRRVLRAIEVIRLTGRPFSAQRSPWKSSSGPRTCPQFFGIRRHPDDLRERIDRRVDLMFERGLVEETRKLLERGLTQNPTAMQAIGYRQVVEHLRGERSLLDTIALVKKRTRTFAKRQMTWFRHQFALEWIDVAPDESSISVAERILEYLGVRRKRR